MKESNEQKKTQQQQQQEFPPVIRSDPFDPNDLQNYVREPGEMLHHIRDPLPSEIAYRL